MKKINLKDVDETILYEKLPNGLEIYLYQTPDRNDFSVQYLVPFGSKEENYEVLGKTYNIKPGTAHFLEHKMFHRGEGNNRDYLSALEELNINGNAYTSDDTTVYLINGKVNFKKGLQLLLTMMNSFYKNDQRLAKEKEIVCQEIKMTQNNGNRELFMKSLELLFLNSYQTKGIGTEEDVNSLTYEELEHIYDHIYSPNNITLFVYGNFTMEEIIKEVNKNKAINNRKNKEFKLISKEEPDEVLNNRFIYNHSLLLEQKNMLVYKRRLKSKEEESVIKHILNVIFSSDRPFVTNLIKNENVTFFYVVPEISDNHIVTYFIFDGTNPEKIKNLVEQEIKETTITKDMWELEKRVTKASSIRRSSNPNWVIGRIMNDLNNYGEIITDINEILANYSIEEINKIKNNLLDENYLLLSGKKKED